MNKKGKIIILSAASGAGKSTILEELRKKKPEFAYSVSATTRSPRGNEKDGVDYFFMSKKDFLEKRDGGGFVEWAKVYDNYYATPRDFIENNLKDGKIIVMDIDVQGKLSFDRQYGEDVLGIFIETPSFEELENRLRKRATDSEETINLRLENAKKEVEFAKSHGNYDYFIVNDDLEKTLENVCKILSEV